MSTQHSSRSTKKKVDATNPGNGSSDTESGQMGDGEGFAPGSRHSAIILERPNKSLNRNSGPERPDANTGMIPTVGKGVRKTGRVG